MSKLAPHRGALKHHEQDAHPKAQLGPGAGRTAPSVPLPEPVQVLLPRGAPGLLQCTWDLHTNEAKAEFPHVAQLAASPPRIPPPFHSFLLSTASR